jgi:hypothetical protein
MNLSKPSSPVRGYVIGAVISALILCSPVIALLMLIAAEALVDLLLAAGTGAVYGLAAGVIVLILFRNFRGFWPVALITAPSVPES